MWALCIKTSVFHMVNHFDFGISKEAYFSASNHTVQQSNHQSGLSVMHSVFACMGSFRYFIQARSLKQHSLLYEFLVRVEGDWCPRVLVFAPNLHPLYQQNTSLVHYILSIFCPLIQYCTPSYDLVPQSLS